MDYKNVLKKRTQNFPESFNLTKVVQQLICLMCFSVHQPVSKLTGKVFQTALSLFGCSNAVWWNHVVGDGSSSIWKKTHTTAVAWNCRFSKEGKRQNQSLPHCCLKSSFAEDRTKMSHSWHRRQHLYHDVTMPILFMKGIMVGTMMLVSLGRKSDMNYTAFRTHLDVDKA